MTKKKDRFGRVVPPPPPPDTPVILCVIRGLRPEGFAKGTNDNLQGAAAAACQAAGTVDGADEDTANLRGPPQPPPPPDEILTDPPDNG